MATKVIIGEDEVLFFGKLKGSNTNKFNRAAKLASIFNELDDKMSRFVERGGVSMHARCALAIRLMMHTGIRVGNEGSAEGYMTKPHPNSKKLPEFVKTYGLTTITKDHIQFARGKCYMNFVGKKQVDNSFELFSDLAAQVKILYRYFQNESKNDLSLFGVTAYELTKFIKKYVGRQFSPKDFRTMRANIEAFYKVSEILDREVPTTKKQLNEEIREVASHVSECLNNTVGVCKKSYIDDMLFVYLIEQRG